MSDETMSMDKKLKGLSQDLNAYVSEFYNKNRKFATLPDLLKWLNNALNGEIEYLYYVIKKDMDGVSLSENRSLSEAIRERDVNKVRTIIAELGKSDEKEAVLDKFERLVDLGKKIKKALDPSQRFISLLEEAGEYNAYKESKFLVNTGGIVRDLYDALKEISEADISGAKELLGKQKEYFRGDDWSDLTEKVEEFKGKHAATSGISPEIVAIETGVKQNNRKLEGPSVA